MLVRRELIPGFRFHLGRLMIVTSQEVKLVDTWPDLNAVRKPAGKAHWTPFVPCFRFLRPKPASGTEADQRELGPVGVRSRGLDPALEKLTAFLHFRHSIPPVVATAVECFPSRQLALLRMCQKRKRARELLEQSPALGFSVAHNEKFCSSVSDSADLAARLSALKQREIARWLGFPGSQAWANILSKIPADIVSLESLLSLKRAAEHSDVEKLLSHLGAINAGVIGLVTSQPALRVITPSLLSEVAQVPDERNSAQLFHLVNDIVDLHSRARPGWAVRPFLTIAEVQRKHQETVDEYAAFLKMVEAGLLPEPPLPGTEQIIPLTDAEQLYVEGCSQHNCVGSYVELVRKGQCYIYKVLVPERATLSIAKAPDGCWAIQQLRLSFNRFPSAATWKLVQDWLDPFSLST